MMTAPTCDDLSVDELCSKAFCRYARSELQRFVGGAIHRLQRTPASGIFGRDWKHKTLWDEYCHYIQYGPSEVFEYAFREPNHVLESISFYACLIGPEYDVDELEHCFGTIREDALVYLVLEELNEDASNRANMENFLC